MKNKINICPICGGNLIEEKRERVVIYKGKQITIKQPAEWCKSCGEGILSTAHIKATRSQLTDFKRTVDNLLTPGQIKKFRKKFKLTQEKASKIFGGGKRAFSEYERGEISQTKSTDLLMRLLNSGKIRIEDIEKII